jgi:hypothetical protein
MNISNIPYVQSWLEQFQKEDRQVAKRLLDQLVYVKSDDVMGALKERVESLISDDGMVALYPIREITSSSGGDSNDVLEPYFSLTNESEAPILQSSDTPLGSEAIASNLIMQISRLYKRKILSKEACNQDPCISNLREKKVKKLILIDDLIGSGKRTIDFLTSFYTHPSIKSWVSSKHVSIEVICFMATPDGKSIVSKWCKKRPNINLHVLNSCPMLNVTDPAIVNLCTEYATEREKYPLGFGNNPVRVVFAHSAPNNLPAILYRDTFRYKPKAPRLRNRLKKWNALFPKRALPEILKLELGDIIVSKSNKAVTFELLQVLDTTPDLSKDSLGDYIASASTQISLCKTRCLQNNWIVEDANILNISPSGREELIHLRKVKSAKDIALNTDNYYPSTMSRALSH